MVSVTSLPSNRQFVSSIRLNVALFELGWGRKVDLVQKVLIDRWATQTQDVFFVNQMLSPVKICFFSSWYEHGFWCFYSQSRVEYWGTAVFSMSFISQSCSFSKGNYSGIWCLALFWIWSLSGYFSALREFGVSESNFLVNWINLVISGHPWYIQYMENMVRVFCEAVVKRDFSDNTRLQTSLGHNLFNKCVPITIA